MKIVLLEVPSLEIDFVICEFRLNYQNLIQISNIEWIFFLKKNSPCLLFGFFVLENDIENENSKTLIKRDLMRVYLFSTILLNVKRLN